MVILNPQASEANVADQIDGSATNPVAIHQRAIRDAFGRDSEAQSTASKNERLLSLAQHSGRKFSDFEHCMLRLLDSMNWSGESRYLTEALPHTIPVKSLPQFSAVMQRLGYSGDIHRIPLEKLSQKQVPCLILKKGGVPGVLHSVSDGVAIVSWGEEQSRTKEVLDGEVFSVACFVRSEHSVNVRDEKHNWVLESLLLFRMQVFSLLALSFAINFLGLATPLYVMFVYDKVFASRAMDTLAFLAVGLVLIFSTEFYLRILRGKIIAFIGARFNAALLANGFGKILGFPISMTESASIGSQLMRIKQFQSISSFFSGRMTNAALDLPFILIFFLVISIIGGPLVWVPICLATCFAAMAIITIPVTKRNIAQTGKARSDSQNLIMETVEHAETIRQLGAEGIWQKRYEERLLQFSKLKFSIQFFDGLLGNLSQGLVMIAGVCTLWVGSLLVMSNELTVGALIAIMMLIWRILSPIQTVFLSFNDLNQMFTTFRQVNHLMRLKVESNENSSKGLHRSFEGEVRFENVGFRYNNRSQPVARNVSFQAHAGEVVALAGVNSSGKSTLLKFINGLYQPQAGAVFVDGLNLKQIDIRELRTSIAYVPQDPVFFYGTVAQNIRLFQPTASDERIAEALSEAGIDLEDGTIFPDGIETRLSGKFLNELPEGFRQRLSLARAYSKNANIYLFDEPFALLDYAGREFFEEKLEKLRAKATIIVATNDLEQIKNSDKVVLLEDGMVLRSGRPDETIAERKNATDNS
ncbi:MAG: peptidase domain-containing ABC transporter [Pseudomonadota bacterium]